MSAIQEKVVMCYPLQTFPNLSIIPVPYKGNECLPPSVTHNHPISEITKPLQLSKCL